MDSGAGAETKIVTIQCAKCHNLLDVTGLDAGDAITCPYCSHQFEITLQFGNFLLERQIGAGGVGAVYLGRDITLNRKVAVKLLRHDFAQAESFLQTFLHEAELTASLNHPNIVQVYAFGEQDGFYYLVMEYIEGGTLDDKIIARGAITELEAVEVGIAVARGLDFAREKGLIHRDIKPGNIVYGKNGEPKVVDFGLSRSYDSMENLTGEIWGTPYYVAPEKLERLAEDFRSDLYSLGASLFHAISGRPPYEAPEPNEVAMKHLTGMVVSLKAFVPTITDITAYAIKKSMARYPEQRHASYAEFIQELEDAKRQILDGVKHGKKGSQSPANVQVLHTALDDNLTRWIALALLILVLVLGALLIWKGPSFLSSDQGVVNLQLPPKPSGGQR